MKKRLCMTLAVLTLIGVLYGSASAVGVTVSDWARSGVTEAADAGIVPDTLPADYTAPITRAQFCAIAVRLYETGTGAEIAGRSGFSDTNDVNVEKMAFLGVVDGIGGGRFDPDGTLTREQAAAILVRLAGAMGQPLPESPSTFSDSGDVSGWAKAAVGQVQAAGIMNGTSATAFSPKGSYTIEQSILTMLRTAKTVENGIPTTTVASGSCGSNVKWTLDSAGTLTISGTGEMGYYNQEKRPWYSQRANIKSVVVEEGVTELVHSAFMGCTGLTSVTLPNGLKEISSRMFSGCTSLAAVNIPESASWIGLEAFENCDALKTITVDGGNPICRSVDGILFNKDMTSLLCYPAGRTQTSYKVPDGVKTIDDHAFSGNDYLTALTIPDSVETIIDNSVEGCDGLTDLYIDNEWHLDSALGFISDSTQEIWAAVNVHTSDVVLTYTVTSAADMKRAADELNTRYPTIVEFWLPSAQSDSLKDIVTDYLNIRFSNYAYSYSLRSKTEESKGLTVLRTLINYREGMDVIPYHESGFSTDKPEGNSAVLLARSEEILDEITTPDMGEYDKVKAIHDWIVNNTRYAYSGRYGGPCGPILDGTAVCEGYSHSFELLCSLSDVDCLFVSGKGNGEAHGWNKVRVDGVWYNVDVTWDDPQDMLRYDYFLISDSTLSKDHTWNKEWLPACYTDYPGSHTGNTSSGSTGGSGSTSEVTGGTTSESTKEDPSEPEEYTGGYWETYVDAYGFTWVELEDARWVLYINGQQYGQDIYESAEAEMAGFYTLDQYIRSYGFRHYLEHAPSEQTDWDKAPRERGW